MIQLSNYAKFPAHIAIDELPQKVTITIGIVADAFHAQKDFASCSLRPDQVMCQSQGLVIRKPHYSSNANMINQS